MVKFVQEASTAARADPKLLSDSSRSRFFLCATIRVLCAWLAEETAAAREDVYEITSFVTSVAAESFAAQREDKIKSLPKVQGAKGKKKEAAGAQQGDESDVVLVRNKGEFDSVL